MAQTNSGVYSWVRDSVHVALGDDKISTGATWKVYLLENGGYNPNFASHEAFSVIGGGAIVASQPVVPGTFAGGILVLPDVTFPLLSGPEVGSAVLTVSGSIERLYAHWGRANDGFPFTPSGTTKKLINLTLVHRTTIT